jgi:cytochrome c peroxidase
MKFFDVVNARFSSPGRAARVATLTILGLTVVTLMVPLPIGAQNGAGPNFGPVTDAAYLRNGNYDADLVNLGRLLFFDEVLSGNRNISCATCHHPDNATGDAISLPLGEGGIGLGVARISASGSSAVTQRVPRNAPPLFNLGARNFGELFHDGRVAIDAGTPSGFRSPAGDELPDGLANVLAAQAMFPITSGVEMAGQRGENRIGRAAARGRLAGNGGVWTRLAKRLRGIPEYVDMFQAAFPDVGRARDITMVHAANAIAEFEMAAFRSDGSPFDQFLRGDNGALSQAARRGMNLFYGPAGCARCHSGAFQTDGEYHSIAMPQIGPGTGDGFAGQEDFGRERVTGNAGDRYEFRTPSLRNVELTSPYGHAGAYASLAAMVRHYRDPANAIGDYDPAQLILPSVPALDPLDLVIMNNAAAVAAIADSSNAGPARLDEPEVADLVAFLRALTDPAARDLSDQVPSQVPSGLGTQ